MTVGKYWVRAILEETDNFTACTTVTDFEILSQTSVSRAFKKATTGLFLKQNPVVGETAEFKLILPDNERIAEMNVVIYDATGNIMFNSGSAVWDLTNRGGRKVANGAYLAIVEAKGADSGRTYFYKTLIAVKSR
jgi:hypothetical protein